MRTYGILVVAAVAFLMPPRRADAAISGLTRVASSLSSPIFVTHAPGDRSRLFIVERGAGTSINATATIKILNLSGPNAGTVNATPFLSIPGVNINGEGGFLGMAFSPNYQTDKKFYVYVTAGPLTTTFTSYIRQYTASANPDVAIAAATEVLSWAQPPQTNHKGGWIGFSPNDGYLYINSGDGGGGGDDDSGHTATIGNAQDITSNWLGKILRVNVNGDDFPGTTPDALAKNYAIPPNNPMKAGVGDPADDFGDDEIWAYGVRNPFRASFDRITGDLWIGDVGQDNREEIDFQPASTTIGSNFGWRLYEGNSLYGGIPSDPLPPNYTAPVYDYGRPTGNAQTDLYRGKVITGGYIYRGPDPSLQGKYFFLDSQNTFGASDDNYWMANTAPFGSVTNINSLLTFDTGTHQFPVSYGEDAVGNVYIVYLGGEVYRLNTNQYLAGDYDHDGNVDNDDYAVWRSTFGTNTGNRPSDGNGNGVVDAADYIIWRNNLGATVHAGAGFGEAVPELTSAAYLLQLAIAMFSTAIFRRRPRLATAVF